jgi:hypothetical protein
MAEPRPTDAEVADAADRFIDALDDAHAALRKAREILRERRTQAMSYVSYPLFTDGRALDEHLEKARDALWAAHKPAAVQGYDHHRNVKRDDRQEAPDAAES